MRHASFAGWRGWQLQTQEQQEEEEGTQLAFIHQQKL
jgi:hypothetical protein